MVLLICHRIPGFGGAHQGGALSLKRCMGKLSQIDPFFEVSKHLGSIEVSAARSDKIDPLFLANYIDIASFFWFRESLSVHFGGQFSSMLGQILNHKKHHLTVKSISLKPYMLALRGFYHWL